VTTTQLQTWLLTIHESLTRVVAIINGKGGVGKTSITANVGGELADRGLKVLVMDCDLSGNLRLDLGYDEHPGNDFGKSIVQAIMGGLPLKVIQDVRPNLDVVPGGRALKMVNKLASDESFAEELEGGSVGTAFAAALARTVTEGEYDMVLIDCAPGNPELQEMVLTASRYVLIPTKSDPGGWDGLKGVGPLVKRVRQNNPLLTYLGIVLFGHSPSATRVLENTKAQLSEVTETVPFFDSYIRHSAATAHDTRLRGQLARELSRDARTLARERDKALKRAAELKAQRNEVGDDLSNVIEDAPMVSSVAGVSGDVADDYAGLGREIVKRIAAEEKKAAAAAEEK